MTFQTSSHGTGDNPFVGLRPFGPADVDVFFGRDASVAELLGRLRATRFLTVVGTSGCGKTSLVLAGLAPALAGGAFDRGGSHWRIAALRPGTAPIEALATVLARTQVLGEQADDPGVPREAILRVLQRGEHGLVDVVQQSRLRNDENLLVVVDQFEELLRSASDTPIADASEAAAFVKLLLTAAARKKPSIYVAITMRADFIGDAERFAGLPEAVNDGLFLVPRLTHDELRAAIEKPVLHRGERIASRLVPRLLNDAGPHADQLPALQYALMRTWDAWYKDHAAGEPLDVRHYEAVGTLSGAVSTHANALYDDLDPRLRQIAEGLFRCLTARDAEESGVRRPTTVSAARAITGAQPGELEQVVRTYAAPGVWLLTSSHPSSNPKAMLDIVHESVMRLWDRLREWVDDEAVSGQIYRALVDDAEMKRAHWTNPQLAVGEAWLAKNRALINSAWATRYDDGLTDQQADASAPSAAARDRFRAALAFLAASAAAPRRRLRAVVATAGIAFLIAAALAGFGVVKDREAVAERNRVETINATNRALIASRAAQTQKLNEAIATSKRTKQITDAEIARLATLTTQRAKTPAPTATPVAPRAKSTAAPTHSPKPDAARRTPDTARRTSAPVATAPPRGRGGGTGAADPCSLAMKQQERAADDTISRQESYNASVAGLAQNAQCGDSVTRVVNEGYLRSTLAAAEHELGIGDWSADLKHANELLATCAKTPALRGTNAAVNCLVQQRFNNAAAAGFGLP